MRPNRWTNVARTHPIGWSLGCAAVMAIAGLLLFGDARPAIMGALVVGLVNIALWRPGGPGRRWSDRPDSIR